MNSDELIKAVNFLESDKGLERDLIFSSIEKGIRLAIIKKYGIDPDSDDARQVLVTVERNKGNVKAQMLVRNEAGVASIKVLAPEELGR
ncbi:MAG: NusA N-terminal domain-containing protein, partial [Gemmataceae bacterium]